MSNRQDSGRLEWAESPGRKNRYLRCEVSAHQNLARFSLCGWQEFAHMSICTVNGLAHELDAGLETWGQLLTTLE